jgi:hypothetical protein
MRFVMIWKGHFFTKGKEQHGKMEQKKKKKRKKDVREI